MSSKEHVVTWEQIRLVLAAAIILVGSFMVGYILTIPGQTELTIQAGDDFILVIPSLASNIPFGLATVLMGIVFALYVHDWNG